MRTLITAALAAASIAVALPAAAQAVPTEGEPCYFNNGTPSTGTIVVQPFPDEFGCDTGTNVELDVFFYYPADPSDPCDSWGRIARVRC